MTDLDGEILGYRILIVDDEPVNVTLLEQMLEAAGYTDVHSTTDPRVVLDRHRDECFDLILLDIRMPHLSGIQVMENLAGEIGDDHVPILVLTAQTDDATRVEALRTGANDFLTKPFQHWEVLLRIRNMLVTRALHKRQRVRADELEEKVRSRTVELRDTQLEVVRRLGRAGEYRDNETGAHVIRMSRSCQLLARAAGLSEDHAELILYATPMHDVGKIGIPDHILLKPGRLDPEERRIMETHTRIGADIIGDHSSDVLRMARVVAQSHHEKWDGTGYPNGLAGDAIPLESRIAAICDVFDALTSERPYKEAWPVERAVGFIQDQIGRHFDPRLGPLFLGILPRVVALRLEFPDEETEPPARAGSDR